MTTYTIVEGTTHLALVLRQEDGTPIDLDGLTLDLVVFTRTRDSVNEGSPPPLPIAPIDGGTGPSAGQVLISGLQALTVDDSPYVARVKLLENGRVVYAPDDEHADRWVVVRADA